MAADVVWTKLRRHMAPYENDMCHTHVHVRACVGAWVCASVINEKAPFLGFLLAP